MSASEVELGVVEPDPVDPRLEQVEALLIATLDNGDEVADIAAAIVEHLDDQAAQAAAELEAEQDDDGGFDVDLWLLRGGTAAYGVMLLAWVVAFGLAVAAVWTTGRTAENLAATAAITFAFGILSGVIGAKVVQSIPDAEVAS